jgi:hypothetical protein
MSPVGPGFPATNWDAMAARKARSVPWWLLTALFVAAVGLALGVTFLVSQAF